MDNEIEPVDSGSIWIWIWMETTQFNQVLRCATWNIANAKAFSGGYHNINFLKKIFLAADGITACSMQASSHSPYHCPL